MRNMQPDKQPRRPHYIPQWAELRGLSQTDIAEAINVDKSTVSRWFGGASPFTKHQEALAELFGCDPESLFRHPDDDWISRFLRSRTHEERERIKAILEAAFPAKAA